MQSERWQQIESIFHASKNVEAAERSAYLDHACGSDVDLRVEVESLLSAACDDQCFLGVPALSKAMVVLSHHEDNSVIGKIFGSYRTLSKLGAGGMGEVFLAEDTKLGRKVALKLLPTRYASDLEFVRRFQQEARSASSLNHPNIITIHEIGEAQGRYFIATEYIAGETLRQRLKRSSLNATEIVNIATQIANALDTAHAAGIIHRDIKPENIMIRTDGLVKIVDFGLARQQSAHRNRIVDSTPGLILGTLGYMSPEQVRGLPADERSDIWSFGVVLYEMITCERLFQADTDADLLSSIINDHPVKIPSDSEIGVIGLQRVLENTIRKKAESRYSSTKSLMEDLGKIFIPKTAVLSHSRSTPFTGELAQTRGLTSDTFVTSAVRRLKTFASLVGSAPRKLRTAQRLIVLTLAVMFVVAAGFTFRIYTRAKPPTLPRQVKVTAVTSGGTWSPGVSPDGKFIAYTASDANMHESIWIKETATGRSTVLVPYDGARYGTYVFSRDGNYLYYGRTEPHNDSQYFFNDIYRIAMTGGIPYKVVSHVSGFNISPDNKHLVLIRADPLAQEHKLSIIKEDGTGERLVSSQKWPRMSWLPSWSPDGRWVTYCARNYGPDAFYNTVMVVPVEGGRELPVSSSKWMDVGTATWLPDSTGLLLTGREGPGDHFQIYRVSYPSGEVSRLTNDLNSYSALTFTKDGKTLIAEVQDVTADIWVVNHDNETNPQQVTYGGKDGVGGTAWTPDGRLVFATISRDTFNATPATGDRAIWIMDADGQNRRQLTFDDGISSDPAVTADGRYIVFSAYRNGAWGIWRMNVDGSEPKQLTSGGTMTNPAASPDGQWVFFKRLGPTSQPTICRVSINGGDVLQISDKNAFAPSVSPDGKFVAFFSSEETGNVVQVVPSTGGEPIKTLSVSPDNEYLLFANIARWSRDGRLLTYTDAKRHVSNIYGIPVYGGPVTQLTHFDSDIIFNFAWSSDGSKLAVARGRFTRQVVSITDFTQ